MNKINFDLKMQKILEGLTDKKPKILLHSCCAPCSSACIERLGELCDLTVFYYNPNMDTEEEYIKRKEEQKKLCELYALPFVEKGYRKEDYSSAVIGLEKEKEGGKRCEKCFELRLAETAEYAKEHGYDFFATTLTVSPLKNAEKINVIGEKIASEKGIFYLPSDFKKQGGYLKSIELSKKFGLYRQNYCGCIYSKIERTIGENKNEIT